MNLASIDVEAIRNLPARLDDHALAHVRAVASAPLPTLAPADPDHFAKCLKMLDVLPRRSDDALTGDVRFKLYRRHFGNYCAEALAHLAQEATISLRFFPSPAECKTILDAWQRNDPAYRAKAAAHTRLRRETEARLDDLLERLKARSLSQAEVDALPEGVKGIADERGYLRRVEGGAFVIRHEPQ